MMYSVSRLQLYERCQAAFYYKYLLELPEALSDALVLGKTVHTAIQRYLSGDALETAVDTALAEAQLLLDQKEVQSLTAHPAVMSIMGGYVEQHFHLPLLDNGNLVIQGYIDYFNHDDSGIVLKDWKTNRSPYEPTDNHQLGLYAWALSQMTGAEEVHGELVFLRYSLSKKQYVYTYDKHDMEEARQWAIRLAVDINGKLAQLEANADSALLFPDQPGVHCQHCGYAELCIRSRKVTPVIVDSALAAKQLALEVIRLEAALSEYKDQLKSWAKANGDIVVGDSSFSFVPSVSWGFSSEKLCELCTELHEAGVDVFEYLSLTAANLKKIGVDDEKLSRFGKKKVTSTFRLVKAKEVS